jgi:hypothetical protein
MPQRSREKSRSNPDDEQANRRVSQGHVVYTFNGEADEQRLERGRGSGDACNEGDDGA